ncbi:MAG TPA: 5'-nucleotidase C-terminal domain-containing protein [Blastocatellia bacterium]|nr:5'-nucleotidase C-terminal domain-containing protein [Blastocatellia bacterium]
MRKRISLWIFCVLIFAPVYASAQQNRGSASATITILQVNDVYEISPVDNGKTGGLARLATLVKQEKARNPASLFLLAGDFLSPSLASKEFKGEQMVDALNAAGLDIAALGNHEFDVDLPTLAKRIGESRFSYLAANVFDKQKHGQTLAGVKPYVIRELGGVRVAIIGLLTTETYTKSTYGTQVSISDPIPIGIRLARQLRRQGADVIIALTHLSLCEDKQLARLADVDLIIGGHEHELLQAMAGHAHISKMGSDARNLGRVDLHLTRTRAGRFAIRDIDWASLPVNDTVREDEPAAQVVAKWEKRLAEKYPGLDDKVGHTTEELDALSGHVRRRETNLGNFLADAYRQAFGDEADAALVNSGGIRSDKTYGPGALTRRDIFNILPFANTLVKARVKGEHLKRLLENGVSRAGEEEGRFPQVSGVTFSYDAAKPVGSRVTSIEIGGAPYDPQRSYTMIVNSYIFDKGGDGYDFAGAERLSKQTDEPADRDAIIKYIKSKGTISPKVEGRIKSAQSEQAPALDPCASTNPPKPTRVEAKRVRRKAA